MSAFGYGGIPNVTTGQIAMDGSPHQIPAPPNSGPKYQVWGVIITAPAGADVFWGPNTNGEGGEPSDNPLTTSTGNRIPQNTMSPYLPVRYLVSLVGSGGTASYALFWG